MDDLYQEKYEKLTKRRSIHVVWLVLCASLIFSDYFRGDTFGVDRLTLIAIVGAIYCAVIAIRTSLELRRNSKQETAEYMEKRNSTGDFGE